MAFSSHLCGLRCWGEQARANVLRRSKLAALMIDHCHRSKRHQAARPHGARTAAPLKGDAFSFYIRLSRRALGECKVSCRIGITRALDDDALGSYLALGLRMRAITAI